MQTLTLSRRLFTELAEHGIRYSHWKSNEHLLEALAGISDLDLLVDTDHRSEFEECLETLGFEKVMSPPIKRFDGLEDYLGFDRATGELLHLHIHHRLVLGEKRVKNHHLPVERWVLDNQTTVEGVEIPMPAVETFLLYIRLLLKADARTAFRCAAGRQTYPFPVSIHRELRHLLSQSEDPELLAAAEQAGLTVSMRQFGEFLDRARTDNLNPWYVLRQRRRLLRQLRQYQRYSTARCFGRKVWYRVRYSRPSQAIWPIQRKSLIGNGLLLGIVGADGSGKTTVSGDLDHWLSWKLRVLHFYFGQPKNLLRLKVIRKTGYALSKLDRTTRGALRPLSWLASRVQDFQWVFIARYRLALGRRAHHAKSKGHIVLAERYPLEDFFDMPTPMDGPRLNRQAQGRVERRMAEKEWSAYRSLPKPDHFLILAGDLATLQSRKPDTGYQEHAEKVAAVNRAAGSRRSIDATLSYESMELEARREVWDQLVTRSR